MSLVRVFNPVTSSERMVVVAMLEAHGIPTLDVNSQLASMLPGVGVNDFDIATVMVPEEHRAFAEALLADFRTRDSSHAAQTVAKFAAFHAAPEAAAHAGQMLTFAVVLAHSAEGVVLVFNRQRDVWELPGGFIDPGEAPRDAAARELREEAGCVAQNLRWLGVVEVNDGRAHIGGVFRCEVDEIPPKVPDAEIGGLACWLPDRPPPGLGESDEALLERFGRD
jgi:8-oxo-dGTP diphosphatase